jgi:hypothetical protein
MNVRSGFIAVCLIFSASIISCSAKNTFVLRFSDGGADAVRIAAGSPCSRWQYYQFSGIQQESIGQYRSSHGTAAIELELSIKSISSNAAQKLKDAVDEAGFLYDSDFTSSGKIKRSLDPRPAVTASFASFSGRTFSVIFCIAKDGAIPSGFFVAGSVPCTVKSAEIVEAQVGFDFSLRHELYAFAPNGGRIEYASYSSDLSGVPLAFNAQTTKTTLMPDMVLSLAPLSKNGNQEQSAVELHLGAEKIKIRASASHSVTIPCAAFSSPYSSVSVSANSSRVLSLLIKNADKSLLDRSVPIKIDPGLIPGWKNNSWRNSDFELFEWDRFPGILYFDTADYAVQDDLFRRLAYYVEKAGYRGRLVPDSELEGKHGYNAHDYSASSLARFFAQAEREHFMLNKRELRLKEILLANGVIIRSANGSLSAGKGAVISVSQESPLSLRTTFIAHEGWHGLYFTDSDFRNTIASVYYTMDPKTLAFLIKYFQITPTLNYDVNDDDLMKNEFMAYMLQRSASQTASYFVNMALREHAQWGEKAEADYIVKTQAAGFVSAATMLDEYVSSRWSLAAGRVWLISR